MSFINKHIADVVFQAFSTDTGESSVKMVIYTDIDPSPASDDGQRALADLMREVEAHTRRHPEIRRIEIIKDN